MQVLPRSGYGVHKVVHTCVAAGRGAVQRGRAVVRTPRAADMDLRLTRPRKRAGAGVGARAVFTCGCRRRVQRAGDRSLGGAGAAPGGGGRGERAPAASPPRGRVRAVVACPAVRRAGVSPKAPGGGGEPRAARPRADAATARSRSAPSPPPRDLRAAGRRRARSLAARLALSLPPAHPAPRLRPVFLWARQRDGTVQEVRCEDYDSRNRIRIARTPSGWRVIPRTEIFDTILVPAATVREKPERRRRRRPGRPRRRRVEAPTSAVSWLAPDLESHIPSHTIAVPRAPPPPPPEPTPLDNLLAVAELEFNQQRGEEALELELQGDTASQYPFLPEAEEVACDVMSFQLGDPKQPEDIFFDRKTHLPERTADEDFQSDIAHVHKDLFETISEAHYLPELGGPHDEALLESLVEKGCEDNQILGQTLDKFAHLVHASGDYAEEEDDMLLGGAPVTDIIDRLGESLESPSRSSMTAAQGLLHLHHIGDHLTQSDHQQSIEQTYLTEEVFVNAEAQSECPLETLSTDTEMQGVTDVNQLDYDRNAEKRLQTDGDPADAMYTEQVPDLPYNNKSTIQEEQNRTLPDNSEVTLPSEISNDENISSCTETIVPKIEAEDFDEGNVPNLDLFKQQSDESSDGAADGVELVATDLSKKACEKKGKQKTVATIAETTNSNEDIVSEPKDLSVHRRLPTPHASPRRIDIPRAPSRESDAMQSPQPSGIPAVPSSPEIFTMPHTKSKQSLFLESLLSSPSPKMYTSEVTITKQHSEPLNLGKHRKSASPTVTSCSDEMRKLNKEFGEPQEKRRRESTEDLAKISKVFNRCEREDQVDTNPDLPLKTPERRQKDKDDLSPLKQLQLLKNNPAVNMPDPLLIPKEKLYFILKSPAREIPALLVERPELRMPEALNHRALLQDPNILCIAISQLETILEREAKLELLRSLQNAAKSASSSEQTNISQPDQNKTTTSTDGLAGELDVANSMIYNHMLWVPYFTQLEAMAACSQNADFLKALSSSGYLGSNYADLSLMNPAARLGVGPTGFPMVSSMDYDNRLQFAMWQEAMNNTNVSQQQRAKNNSAVEAQMREMASKSSDVQNPYVHSTKNHQSIGHNNMSSRSSPMASNYNAAAAVAAGQRAAALQHNQFLQNMYSGINPNIRPNVPLSGLQISPYYNPNLMGRDQRSPRSSQQKSPSSPFYPNNNYLQSVQSKQSDTQMHRQRSSSTGSHQSTESPRPRISVKSLHNLLEPTAAAAATGPHSSSGRRSSNPPAAALGRRRDEPEVGSTTPLGEPPLMPPHPHDPASFHLWHPLFGK
ncbi:unnamed protein product [Arctia plantaginis]|uniref:Uncharacterized protein n=1 Tax=Arctia plantaginis TaxID=874455 RepID=A0A8S0ZV80_ARCPL|nr:unnamed protein product [Arctia plantaginis]CAB3261092.1 unnamed protein product [Arctia plantaginis]